MVCVVCPPGAHRYVYGPVPEVGFAVITPLHPPLQLTLVAGVFTVTGVDVEPTVMVCVIGGEHEIASSTVTVYVPAQSPVAVAALPPEGAQE